MTPTLTTSMAKIAAAMGVPKRAAKPALMPQRVIMCISLMSSRKSRPRVCPKLPPSCKAAPSRPAEPPNRWVITVAVKIKGAVFQETVSRERTENSTISVPGSLSMPHF